MAPTELVRLPAEPDASQRLSVTLRTLLRTMRNSPADSDHVVVVELAGRGLAEFWTVFLLSRAPFRRRIWVTVHDTPAVSGGSFYFKALDRRGGRRVASWLSNWLGQKAERVVLQKVERVYCLSTLGAKLLVARFSLTRSVQRLPFISPVSKGSIALRQSIFMPGYLDGVQNVAPVILAVAAGPDWCRLEIGSCSEETKFDVASLAYQLRVQDRVELLGYLDEKALDAAFERAAIVVRWRDSGWLRDDKAQQGAVSGALMNALAHGCAIVTNDSRGIVECLTDAESSQVGNGQSGRDELQAVLSELLIDGARRERMGTSGRAHISNNHSIAVVALALADS